MIADRMVKYGRIPGKTGGLTGSHMLQSTGHAFREKCNLHTDYNNQEIFVFELVHLKVDILNFL